MWAEEATVHLRNSFNLNLWEMLVFIPEKIGYFCLNINIATIIIRFFPIEYAALISTIFGLVFQSIGHFIIIGSKNKIWGSATRRIITSTALIIIPVGTGETWLNTTCAHYHLAIMATIILLDYSTQVHKITNIIYCIMLGLAALSSPVGCFIIVGYYYAKLFCNFKISYSCLIAYSLACFTQTFIAITIIHRGDTALAASRFQSFQIFELPSVLINDVIIKSTLGDNILLFTITAISKLSNLISFPYNTLYFLLFFIFILVFFYFRKSTNYYNISKVLVFTFFITFILLFISVSDGPFLLGRNSLVPASIFILIIIHTIEFNSKYTKLLLIFFLFNSSHQYYSKHELYYSEKWPTWNVEIKKWKKNPNYEIKVWPRNNSHWHFLDDKDWKLSIPIK
jgi:hypothetical protein